MLFITLLPVLFYFRLFAGFFQQDEWYGFAWYLLHQDSLKYIFAPSVGHWNPLTLGTNHILFTLGGMNYTVFLITSLTLHLLVIALVYLLGKEIFRDKKLAALTAFLFAILAAHYQGTAWIVANVGTHLATIFGLLATIFFLRRRILVSMALLLVSLLFKEIAIGLFLLFLLYLLLFAKKDKNYKKQIKIIIGVGAFYVLVRTLMLFGPNIAGDQLVSQSQDTAKLAYNFFTVPLKAISQSIVPIDILREVAESVAGFFPENITGEIGSPAFEVFVVKRVLEAVSLLVSSVIAALILIKFRSSKTILLGLLWIVTNSFIFAFAPGRSGVIFVIDSRNLYFVSIGAAIMLMAMAQSLSKGDIKKMVLLLLIIVLPNAYFLNKNLMLFVERGSVRKSILANIQLKYSDLPEKVVFYTQSDQTYYGLPPNEKILPFQSGLGQILLVLYYPSEGFPKKFFEDRFLWEISDQGYKEAEGRGFGYFRDKDLLKEAVEQYNLPEESIIAFDWDGKKNFLSDITQDVRDEIFSQ